MLNSSHQGLFSLNYNNPKLTSECMKELVFVLYDGSHQLHASVLLLIIIQLPVRQTLVPQQEITCQILHTVPRITGYKLKGEVCIWSAVGAERVKCVFGICLFQADICTELYDTIRNYRDKDGRVLCEAFIRVPKRRWMMLLRYFLVFRMDHILKGTNLRVL